MLHCTQDQLIWVRTEVTAVWVTLLSLCVSATVMAIECFIHWIYLVYCATLECRKEQRATIKACSAWGFDPVHTHNALVAIWGDHTLSKMQVRHWLRVFRLNPDHGIDDYKCPGCLKSACTAVKIQAVDHALDFERWMTSCQLGAQVHMSHTSVLKVLHKDLGMCKIAPRFVPCRLTQDLVDERLEYSRRNLEQIVAIDETWCFTYDPWSKCADMQWAKKDEPRPSKPLRGRSQKKLLLILFFDMGGMISKEFVEGTVNSEVYIQALRNMREAMRRKRPLLWQSRDFHLLQDNTSPHTSDNTNNYLLSVSQSVWQHPRYSPDLLPCNFWAFPALKARIKGHVFQNLDDLQTTVCRELCALPAADFVKCFNNLAKWYEECANAHGQYFKGKGHQPCLALPQWEEVVWRSILSLEERFLFPKLIKSWFIAWFFAGRLHLTFIANACVRAWV